MAPVGVETELQYRKRISGDRTYDPDVAVKKKAAQQTVVVRTTDYQPPKPKRATSIFAPALQPVALASLWKATAGADGADAIDAADADANAARVEAAMGRMREAISDVLGGP